MFHFRKLIFGFVAFCAISSIYYFRILEENYLFHISDHWLYKEHAEVSFCILL